MKINYDKVAVNCLVGRIQEGTEAIVEKVLAAVKAGTQLDKAIYYVDCASLAWLSEEEPTALPLMGKGGKTIGISIQGNELVDDEEEASGSRWETFDIITVEVPDFDKYN